jgi:hypothetical protein
MRILEKPISRAELKKIAEERFGDLVKAVVDIDKGIMAIGGDMHADEEALLLEQGSLQSNLWGINIYPNFSSDQWIEFDSMINVRPSDDNRSRGVENESIRKKIVEVVNKWIMQ